MGGGGEGVGGPLALTDDLPLLSVEKEGFFFFSFKTPVY